MKLKLLFPPLRVWVQALDLALAAYSGPLFFALYFWGLLALLLLLLINGTADPLAALLALAALVGCWCSFVVVIWLWRGMLQLLWSSPPKWMVSRRGLRVRLHQFNVILLASVPLTPLGLTQLAITMQSENFVSQIEIETLTELLLRYFWLYLVSCAYLLYWFPLKEKAQPNRSPVQGTDQPT